MTHLKKIRKASGKRLREVAAVLHVTPQSVHEMEKKGIAKVQTAKRYAAVFGCDWRELLD